MAYTTFIIPNASGASFPVQSELFSQDLQILADGLHGNGVVNGCAVTQRGAGANMSVDVAAGNLIREGTTVVVAGGNAVVGAAHATLNRIDLVSANNLGALVVTTGTAATLPEPPVIPQVSNVNNILLAFVYVPAADTAINTNQIVDKRALVNVPGSGSGAPTTADYLVRTTNAGLSAERVVTDTATVTWDWSTPGQAKANAPAAGGGDFSSNTTTSVDGEAVVFSGTLGKTGKRATGTGPARLASGVLGTGSTSLASEVTGDLPLANVVPASAATRLLGRGAAAGAGDFQEITLGANLTMTGTSLAASGGGTTPTGTGFPHVTAGAQDAAAKLVDTADVNNAQITYAKLQNVSAASKLLGRGSAGGAGSPEEITLGANLTMTGTTLSAAGGAGGGDFSSNTATSVDSEVVLFSGTTGKLGKRATGTGITRVAAGVQSAAELSGDITTSGSNVATIANNAVTYAKQQDVSAASRLLGRGSAAGAGDSEEITLGTNLSMSGTTLNATGGGGGSSDVLVALASDLAHSTNSTTLENVTGFLITTTSSATEIWRVDVMMVMNVNAAGGTAVDFKFGWAVSGGQTGIWGSQVEREVGVNVSVVLAPTLAATLAFGGNGSLAQSLVQLTAMVASNGVAGTVQLQFAQNSLQASAVVTAKRLSSFIARKVAS